MAGAPIRSCARRWKRQTREARPCPTGTSPALLLPSGAKAGPWVVEHELGRGGMGACMPSCTRRSASAPRSRSCTTLLDRGFNADRILLEARVVNQVGHPNIVDIFETGTLADGRPYIVMERLDGEALATRADEGEAAAADLVIAILLQVCDALIAAHAAGIVHRDLKLDNVFLVDNPDDPATPQREAARLGHRQGDEPRRAATRSTASSSARRSTCRPSRRAGGVVTPQTDVYSLGVMAYELFLEQLPFEAETAAEVMAMHLHAAPPPPRELWPDIPRELEAAVARDARQGPGEDRRSPR